MWFVGSWTFLSLSISQKKTKRLTQSRQPGSERMNLTLIPHLIFFTSPPVLHQFWSQAQGTPILAAPLKFLTLWNKSTFWLSCYSWGPIWRCNIPRIKESIAQSLWHTEFIFLTPFSVCDSLHLPLRSHGAPEGVRNPPEKFQPTWTFSVLLTLQ